MEEIEHRRRVYMQAKGAAVKSDQLPLGVRRFALDTRVLYLPRCVETPDLVRPYWYRVAQFLRQ